MNKNILMIVSGVVTLLLIIGMIAAKSSKNKKDNGLTAGVEVLVAAKSMNTGERIVPASVKWVAYPEATVFDGMIKRKEQADENKLDVYNKPLKRGLTLGEPVTRQAVVSDAKGSGNFLSASIREGMRAMAVPVKAETGVAGFVAPGDYVDVILTYQPNLRGSAADYAENTVQKYASETVLSNIRVLAVDQNYKESSREVKVSRTVTLEVNKEGSQLLAMASSMGTISLSLRRLGEKDTDADKVAPVTTDVTATKVIREIYGNMDKSRTNNNTVRVYNGDAVVNVPVRATPKEEAAQ